MALYRFYYIGSDGHFAGPPAVAEFSGDHEAVKAAEALLGDLGIEVWEATRMVIRLEPKHK